MYTQTMSPQSEVSQFKATLALDVPGQPLYNKMKIGFDYKPILKTAIEECGVDTTEDAQILLDAFLQWLSVAPAREDGKMYVMMKSDVDRIFHAFVLNTKSYREFCEKFLGHFLDHTPVSEDVSKEHVDYTVELLDEYFGDTLHPSLKQWKYLSATDVWKVSCKW